MGGLERILTILYWQLVHCFKVFPNLFKTSCLLYSPLISDTLFLCLVSTQFTSLPPSHPQITPETSVGEIVEEVSTNKSLPPDHYALYLVIGEGDSYRVLSSSDRLLAALSSVGSECHLCLKPNAFYESIKPFVSFVSCGGRERGGGG